MSTYTPTYVFSADRSNEETNYSYNENFYDLLERAVKNETNFNTRAYNFRGDAHIYSVIAMCEQERLRGLDFIGYELSIIDEYQLKAAQSSLTLILDIIEISTSENNLDRLKPLTGYCYSSEEEIFIDDVRGAFLNTGNLKNVSPYNTGGDGGLNVLHSIFDYIKSLKEIVTFCIDNKRTLINFHHPA